MNRRNFIKRSAAMMAIGSAAGREMFAAEAAKRNKGRIGIQLYSVKDELPKDFEGTLKKLSDMGYALVEPYGFNADRFLGHTMKELSVIVKDMGMTISGTHTGSGMMPEDMSDPKWDFWKKCAAEIKSGGGKWAIQAGFPEPHATLDDLKRISAHFNRVGEVCKKGGVRFAYHNHHQELEKIENEVILDFIVKNTDPKFVSFQLDLGHAVRGGGDCLRYMRDFPGRFKLWHASDFDVETQKYTVVGKGSVPYKELFALPRLDLEQLTVEQETGGDIFAACKADFDYLKQFKWTQV
jgi:sugar phosphate isomerase/epimerase